VKGRTRREQKWAGSQRQGTPFLFLSSQIHLDEQGSLLIREEEMDKQTQNADCNLWRERSEWMGHVELRVEEYTITAAKVERNLKTQEHVRERY
jgi:hypothetical protein